MKNKSTKEINHNLKRFNFLILSSFNDGDYELEPYLIYLITQNLNFNSIKWRSSILLLETLLFREVLEKG